MILSVVPGQVFSQEPWGCSSEPPCSRRSPSEESSGLGAAGRRNQPEREPALCASVPGATPLAQEPKGCPVTPPLVRSAPNRSLLRTHPRTWEVQIFAGHFPCHLRSSPGRVNLCCHTQKNSSGRTWGRGSDSLWWPWATLNCVTSLQETGKGKDPAPRDVMPC